MVLGLVMIADAVGVLPRYGSGACEAMLKVSLAAVVSLVAVVVKDGGLGEMNGFQRRVDFTTHGEIDCPKSIAFQSSGTATVAFVTQLFVLVKATPHRDQVAVHLPARSCARPSLVASNAHRRIPERFFLVER